MNNRKHLIFQMWLVMLLTVTIVCVLAIPAFAEDDNVTLAYEKMDLIFDALKIIYTFFMQLSLPIMAVSLALMALEVLLGGERAMEKAMQAAKWMLIGYAVLVFLPTVLSALMQTFKNTGMLYQPGTTH